MCQLCGGHKEAAGGRDNRGYVYIGNHLGQCIDNSANQSQNDARANVINNGGQGTKNSRANNTTDARGNTADQADFFAVACLFSMNGLLLYCIVTLLRAVSFAFGDLIKRFRCMGQLWKPTHKSLHA